MNTDGMTMARAEREDFVAYLDGLSPEQWNAPTLCDRWIVREMVAHCFGFDGVSWPDLARQFVRGRLSTNRINQNAVENQAQRTPDDLLAVARNFLEPSGLTAGFGGLIALTDNMIHQQDIRRPLGTPRRIPADRLRAALDFLRFAPTILGAWRARGVRLVADDLDWSHGRGQEVRGSGEALLMVMAGRPVALDDLSGPGLARLARRF